MSILRYEFKDKANPWTLEPVEFADFSLLVGVSGVGKTRTLNSLSAVCAAGCGRNTGLYNCEWEIKVKTDKGHLTWRATTAGPPPLRSFATRIQTDAEDETGVEFHGERRPPPVFLAEMIEDEQGNELVERNHDGILLGENSRPIKMKDTESVVSLLQEEDSIAPLYQSLRNVHRSRTAQWSFIRFDSGRIKKIEEEVASVEDLQNKLLPMGQKAYVLQQKFTDEFTKVFEAYQEIFPQVQRISVGPLSQFRQSSTEDELSVGLEFLNIAIEELGVEGYVLWEAMSAGMRRTLRHLLELALAPRGTVMLVDEYENSMGINCLDAVTEKLLAPTRDLQLIITSHHPYVINSVPLEHWRVVRRTGSTVRIVPASAIPSLATTSKQDAFTLLVNAAEYQDGVQ